MPQTQKKFTIQQFSELFPDDDTCLDFLFKKQYGDSGCPACAIDKQLVRIEGRRAYQCPTCRHQVYPTAGTIFEKTTTPLTQWFYAIYLYTTTRNGVAAKELERALGICYVTALRMSHKIRELMADTNSTKLFGVVSADESYLGMLSKNMHKSKRAKLNLAAGENKTGVMGMISSDGRVVTKVLGVETGDKSFLEILKDNIDPESTVVTDAFLPYRNAKHHFKGHVVVDHTKNEFVKDGFTTNNIENYWSHMKRMIKGTHIHVSRKYLHRYIAENTFRYMNRKEPEKMFHKILDNIQPVGKNETIS